MIIHLNHDGCISDTTYIIFTFVIYEVTNTNNRIFTL